MSIGENGILARIILLTIIISYIDKGKKCGCCAENTDPITSLFMQCVHK